VIITKRLDPRSSRRLVEPAFRKWSPHRLDALGCSTRALVLNHLDTEPGIFQVVAVAQTRNGIGVQTIMRQIADGLPVTAMMQLVGVVAENLALAFDVVEDSDLLPYPLNNPNRARISLGPRTASLPRC
jgi:hypothetical protein